MSGEEAEPVAYGYLAPDPQQIVDSIKAHPEGCNGATIKRLTGFGQEKLSNLLSALEASNVITYNESTYRWTLNAGETE